MREGEAEVSSSAPNGRVRLSPGAARRQLGADLRSLRRATKMTLDAVATEIQRSTATMSRLERGTSVPRLVDVRALLDLYSDRTSGLVTEDTRSSMLELVRESREGDWFAAYRDVFGNTLSAADFQRYVELESDARRLLWFEHDLVPGLLQTDAYATEVAEAYLADATPRQRRRFVEFRLARQRVLERVELRVVISEVALRRRIAPPPVMVEQLEQLSNELRNGRKNVTVRLAPLALALPAAMHGPFVVMQFGGEEPDLVYLESRAGATYLRSPDDVARYESDYENLWSHALDEHGSLDLLEEVAKSYS